MKRIPDGVNYFEAFLTFACPLKCGYCINGDTKPQKSMSASEWVDGLNRIDFGDVPLTLGGGEPTVHPEFFDILDGVDRRTSIDLLTNAQFDIGEFIARTTPDRFTKPESMPAYRPIRISYHPSQMDAVETIDKTKQLQDAGFAVGLFSINHPNHLKANMGMAELARQKQVYFFVKDFLGDFDCTRFGHYKYPEAIDGSKKEALCRTKDFLVGPAGDIYKCHRDLYKGENPIGNIQDDDVPMSQRTFSQCSNYGHCNPCDVKKRANRFLDTGDCNVEIIPRQIDNGVMGAKDE